MMKGSFDFFATKNKKKDLEGFQLARTGVIYLISQ